MNEQELSKKVTRYRSLISEDMNELLAQGDMNNAVSFLYTIAADFLSLCLSALPKNTSEDDFLEELIRQAHNLKKSREAND